MRQSLTAFSFVTLLLISLIVPQSVDATNSSISTDMTWSSEQILTGNVTITYGATLTIEPGTTIDCGDDFWIQVDGIIISQEAHFFSSTPPLTQGSHGAGLWKGLLIGTSGIAYLNDTVIENAKTAVKVLGELYAVNLQINHSYIGINNIGITNINGYNSYLIDYDSIQNSGSLELLSANIEQSAVGIHTIGITTVSDTHFSSVGIALNTPSGEIIAQDIELYGVTVGITSQLSSKVRISEITGQNIALFIDAANSDDLQVRNAELSGDRILVSNSAISFLISNISFNSNTSQNRPVIDQQCIGSCTLDNISISNTNLGISLSGPGNHILDNLVITATDYAIEATGNGYITGNNLTIQAQNTGLVLRGPSSILTGENTIHMMQSQSIGIDILDSQHTWSNMTINKTYNQQDTTSLALNAWYAMIDFDKIIINNFSTGTYLEDSNLNGDLLEVHGGIDSAVELEQSELIVGMISTKYQAFGIQMHHQSYLQTNEWIAELHNSPLKLFNNSQANIRSFGPLNTNSNSYDASGDGTILYGGSTSITVSTTSSGFFEETTVAFTDISGNPVQAIIKVNGFEIESNVNGYATLPLISHGSIIEATFAGTGVTQTLMGGQSNQIVQIPVIPQGDWIISSGQSVILGPRPDGQPHYISGNLTIAGDGVVKLTSTELVIGPNFEVSLLESSQIMGEDAIISAEKINVYSTAKITSSNPSKDFLIDSMINWSCTPSASIIAVTFNQSMELHSNCNIEMLGGSLESSVNVHSGGSFTQLSSLEILVIDKGTPVQGALISINGSNQLSDQLGRVSINATARYIDENVDNFGGMQNITLQIDSFFDFVTWDSSKSFYHTFMASTITPGILSQSINLEAQWSPYYLENDLIIPQLKTLKVDDGVSFRISDGASITVHGTLDAGTSTFSSTGSGARWAGLILGDYASSRIELSNTAVVEAITPLYVSSTGSVYGDGLSLMRSTATEPLLYVQAGSNALVEIKNAQLSDGGSGCIELYQSQIQLLLSNIELSNCNGPGIWARQTSIQASNITIGEGVEIGFDLTEVSGIISSIDATQFTGTGNVIWLDNMDEQFTLNSIVANTGGSAALAGINNRNLNIDSIEITGAPAIDFDFSAGTLSNIKLIGLDSGNGMINHHGRSSNPMIVENLELQNYSVGIDLHADGAGISAPFIIRDSVIDASTTISAENYSALIERSTLTGQSELSDSTIIKFIDTLFLSQTPIILWNGAEAVQYHTIIIDAQLLGIPQFTEYDIIATNSDGSTLTEVITGITVLHQLPVNRQVEGGVNTQLSSLEIIASSPGLPIQSISFDKEEDWAIGTNIIITFQPNSPPSVIIITPIFGQKIMQQQIFQANASVSDDLDSISELTYIWTILDAQSDQIFQINTNSPTQNLTVPSPGMYVLQLEAIDKLGASTLVSLSFESILLDSDGDNTDECDQNSWFDLNVGHSCGPDIYDSDDDNDGFDDDRDAWPLDICAWQDTDNDQQPDNINCPPGYTTILFEDQDDDGDGIPDSLEGKSNNDSDNFDTLTMMILAIGVLVLAMFLFRLKKGDGQEVEKETEKETEKEDDNKKYPEW